MGRMYSVEFENVAVIAAQDFFELTPAANKPCAIHAIFLSQSTETGDAAEEMLRVKIIRGFATTGSGGGTSTPAPLNPIDTAAGATCKINNGTIASAGTPIDLHAEAFNVRTGWIYIPTPEMRPIVTSAQVLLVVQLMAAPGDSVTMGGTLYFEELT